MKTKIKVTPEQQAWIEARGGRPWTAVVVREYPYNGESLRLASLHNTWDAARHEASARNRIKYPRKDAGEVKRADFLERFEMVIGE